MSVKEKELYEFRGFRLDVAEHFLVRLSGKRVPLSEKAFETLCVLVRNNGHLVQKDELLNQVWADSFVEENNLDKCIHAIRRALGEKPGEQKIIETVRKHGYRFVAEVRRIEEVKPIYEESQIPLKTKQLPTERVPLTVAQTQMQNVGELIASEDQRHEADGNQPEESIGQTAAVELASANSALRSKPKYRTVLVAGLILGAIGIGYYFFVARKTASGVSDKKTIAVLPLKPINTANRDEIYEVGIADSLILRLSSMEGLVVRPLSATRKYADIGQDPLAAGREQQVDYVLASNYQLAGGKIKVTSQLFNVANGQIEGTYQSEQDAANVFVMQDAIAGEVGNKLLARFAITSSGPMARRGTSNEEAYRLYLQGRNLTFNRTPASARKAVEYFEQAIRLDPNFAPAYSGMAHALITSGNLGGGLPRVEYEKAKESVQKALALENNFAEGYAVLGELKFTYEWDFAGAEKDLLRAVELEPNADLAHERYAFYLAVRGRFDEAIAEAKKAQEFNPSSLQHQQVYGVILYLARRYDEAILQLRRVIEVDQNHATAYAWLWLVYEMKGDGAQACEWFMKNQKRIKSEHLERFQKVYETSGWRGVRQEVFEVNKVNEQQKPSANYYSMARQCALVGNKEQAFEYLKKAIEKRQGQMIMLNVEPAFDILRGDLRFDELVRRVGLK
jgi:DNA-binding winged helix-turn-helix (wHTH) protein/TolB-like protein/Tfp pilus assembly protein PilF